MSPLISFGIYGNRIRFRRAGSVALHGEAVILDDRLRGLHGNIVRVSRGPVLSKSLWRFPPIAEIPKGIGQAIVIEVFIAQIIFRASQGREVLFHVALGHLCSS